MTRVRQESPQPNHLHKIEVGTEKSWQVASGRRPRSEKDELIKRISSRDSRSDLPGTNPPSRLVEPDGRDELRRDIEDWPQAAGMGCVGRRGEKRLSHTGSAHSGRDQQAGDHAQLRRRLTRCTARQFHDLDGARGMERDVPDDLPVVLSDPHVDCAG
jgi:hypothetical protein